MEIDLTTIALFKNFVEIEKGDLYIDLHNCFNCQFVNFSKANKELRLSFEANKHAKGDSKSVEVIFSDCCVKLFSNNLLDNNNNQQTIDMMYRGRFLNNGVLFDNTEDGSNYYYINFDSGSSIEASAKRVVAVIS